MNKKILFLLLGCEPGKSFLSGLFLVGDELPAEFERGADERLVPGFAGGAANGRAANADVFTDDFCNRSAGPKEELAVAVDVVGGGVMRIGKRQNSILDIHAFCVGKKRV